MKQFRAFPWNAVYRKMEEMDKKESDAFCISFNLEFKLCAFLLLY